MVVGVAGVALRPSAMALCIILDLPVCGCVDACVLGTGGGGNRGEAGDGGTVRWHWRQWMVECHVGSCSAGLCR